MAARLELNEELSPGAAASSPARPSPEERAQLVRESFEVAIQTSIQRCGRCYCFFMMLVVLGAACVLVWAEGMYEKFGQDACDQPLALMLRLFYIIGLVNAFRSKIASCCLCHREGSMPPRVKVFRAAMTLAAIVWPLAAAYMLHSAKSCSVELMTGVRVVLFYYVVAFALSVVFPLLMFSTMLCLVRRGLIRAPANADAAPEDFIELLEVVEFDPNAFGESTPSQFPATCSICLDVFDARRKITRTPCAASNFHVFHTDCLRGWLRCSRTCPLCREDLVQAHEARPPWRGRPARTAQAAADDCAC